jgi:hypothetical protein
VKIRIQVYFKAVKSGIRQSLIYGLFVSAFLLCCAGQASSVVLHPDGEPNLATWTDRPDLNVVGRWGTNASCVAISSNCVITVRHSGGGAGTLVRIGGRTYTVDQTWNYGSADIRVARLYGANLTSFVSPYENINEVGKQIVIGGYGDGRGAILETAGTTYGYEWDNSANTTRRFGTNRVDYTADDSTLGSLTSDVIIADFDGLTDDQSTIYEGISADHDSGGGWFIKVGDTWKVAGLVRAIEDHDGQSWFRSPTQPSILHPDYLDAVRVSSYADWILATIPERLPGDLTGDDWVDLADFAVFAHYWESSDCHSPDWCAGADSEPDGDVDWDDLAALLDNWLCDDGDCY